MAGREIPPRLKYRKTIRGHRTDPCSPEVPAQIPGERQSGSDRLRPPRLRPPRLPRSREEELLDRGRPPARQEGALRRRGGGSGAGLWTHSPAGSGELAGEDA